MQWGLRPLYFWRFSGEGPKEVSVASGPFNTWPFQTSHKVIYRCSGPAESWTLNYISRPRRSPLGHYCSMKNHRSIYERLYFWRRGDRRYNFHFKRSVGASSFARAPKTGSLDRQIETRMKSREMRRGGGGGGKREGEVIRADFLLEQGVSGPELPSSLQMAIARHPLIRTLMFCYRHFAVWVFPPFFPSSWFFFPFWLLIQFSRIECSLSW